MMIFEKLKRAANSAVIAAKSKAGIHASANSLHNRSPLLRERPWRRGWGRHLTNAVLFAALAWAAPASAQEFPSRNIRLIVSFPPGGGIDAVARLFAEKMSPILGQTVVVENRGGASGLIAGRFVAGAEPDGYTVLIASNSMIIAQLINASPGMSIERDLQAVASVAPQANIVVAAPDLPVTSLKELIALAGKRSLNYASPGAGSVPQLVLENLFTTLPNVRMTHVPFPGAAAALTATISSQTEVAVVTLPPAVPLVNAGKVKGIAVTTKTRSAALPNVPTAAEAGHPSITSTVWTAFFVPAKTPKPIAAKLNEAVLKVAAMPDIKERLTKLGFEPTSIGGEQFQRDVAAELKMWADVIQKAGIKPK
jgi:tripartite-type tricarboxylate transporter receptor subunit TctC